MDHRSVLTVLLLFQGLTQVSMAEDKQVEKDISTRILEANKRMSHLLMEGDVALPKTRNAMKCFTRRCKWPKSTSGLVEIPFKIEPVYKSFALRTIQDAMNAFHTQTCIRFVPYAGQTNYLIIQSNGGCWSDIGMQRGAQYVSIDISGCISEGVIQHELLHALGFYHEHTRSDRDKYVTINFQNIDRDNYKNFDKQDTNNLDTPYDYSSVMHYGRRAFAQGKDSIIPIPDASVPIGQRQGMSRIDIQRINKLYECRG
uniref:Metalloendopeptidase n=1 Tax=Plecoglossus altivelis altivelis TaxID=281464 RepID=Q14TI2_PLEAT|nr:hatching enzyme [Plecoglossus altivelis altivelis]